MYRHVRQSRIASSAGATCFSESSDKERCSAPTELRKTFGGPAVYKYSAPLELARLVAAGLCSVSVAILLFSHPV